MAADSAFTVEKLTASRPGETVEVGPWLVRFEGVAPVAGPNWTAVEAELRASRGGGVHVLRPQSRFFTSPPTETNEAAIKTLLNGQLYTVFGSGGRRRALAVALVVEAARDADLARRRARRSRRADRIRWTRSSGLAEEGADVSRAFRLLPIILLVWVLLGLCMASHPAARSDGPLAAREP